MVGKIEDPTRDTGTGAGDTVPETQRDRTMGTARYSVADEMVTLVEKMETTMEVDVREGGMVTTPTPHQDGQKMRGGGQNFRLGGRLA